MPVDPRLFGTFTLDMMDSPKIDVLSDSAFRGWMKAIFWSRRHLTDGFIPDGMVKKFFSKKTFGEVTNNHPERPSLFKVEGGYQLHDFGQHQSTKADIEAKREAGRKGGRAKAEANKSSSEPVAGASDVLKQKASEKLAKTETESTTSNEVVNIVQIDHSREFAEWWDLYPRKQGKADALRAFKAKRKTVPFEVLRNGAQAYALLNIGEDKNFLKLPAGWLRDERWEDEQIVNSTRNSSTGQPPECPSHPGYPAANWAFPCVACERDELGSEAQF